MNFLSLVTIAESLCGPGALDAALKAGEDPRNVWLALCRAQSVPESRWHGLNKNTKK